MFAYRAGRPAHSPERNVMKNRYAHGPLAHWATGPFDGVPYLATRIVPGMFHVILLPENLGSEELVDIARCQVHANRLSTALVLQTDCALCIAPGGREDWNTSPTVGDAILTGRLQPCRAFPETRTLAARRLALERFIDQVSVKDGVILGDTTRGGRPATLLEKVRFAGKQPNGVPCGLDRCAHCGEWHGRCLDPSPTLAGNVIDVHCRCDNDSRCAACGAPLYERKVNANYYNEADGHIGHVPGFSAFNHQCARIRHPHAGSMIRVVTNESEWFVDFIALVLDTLVPTGVAWQIVTPVGIHEQQLLKCAADVKWDLACLLLNNIQYTSLDRSAEALERDSVELVRKMTHRFKRPIIAFYGFPDSPTLPARVLDAGAVAVFRAPCPLNDVLGQINRCLPI
jgi:hypothetical protein